MHELAAILTETSEAAALCFLKGGEATGIAPAGDRVRLAFFARHLEFSMPLIRKCLARPRLVAIALLASVLLSACGGGGGGSDPAAQTPADSAPVVQRPALPGPEAAALCGLDPADTCYLDQPELMAIQAEPSSFRALYEAHKAQFMADLGPAFAGITDEGAALAFAGVVAYELKGYRDVGSSAPVPASWQLGDLLATPELVCNEYVELALQLFYGAYPQTDASPLQIVGVGWRRDSPVNNHAQLLVTGAGVDLLIDPDLGLVARTTLSELLAHVPVMAGGVFVRTDRAEANLQEFKPKVLNALASGTFDPKYLIYSFVASDAGQAGGLKPFASADDFTTDVVRGPDDRFWYLQEDGEVWKADAMGLTLALSNADDLATGPNGDAVYARTTDGSVYAGSGTGPWNLVRTDVASIAAGRAGDSVLLLANTGELWSVDPSGLLRVGQGVSDIETGQNGAGVYVRPSIGGTLQVYNASGWIDLGRNDIAQVVGDKSGQGVYVRTLAGDLYRINAFGGWELLQQGVSDVLEGIGGLTLNVLKTDGTVWQADLIGTDWNTDGFAWTQLWPGDTFTQIDSPNSGMTLRATRSDGGVVRASASTY